MVLFRQLSDARRLVVSTCFAAFFSLSNSCSGNSCWTTALASTTVAPIIRGVCGLHVATGKMKTIHRLDSTLLTTRRQRTGTITGEGTGPNPHNPSRPLRSQHRMHTTETSIASAAEA
eukprot:2032972-Prymnesium_polylepis.1